MRIKTILVMGLLATSVGLIGVSTPASHAQAEGLSAQESRWLDRRISEDERKVLDSIVGYAPPEIPSNFNWYQSESISLAAQRGKVVVIQSWTRSTVAGRAAPIRAAKVLEKFSSDNVQILAIHTPDAAQGAGVYLERRDIGVPVVVDEKGAYCDELGAFDRPVSIVLDKQGAVRYTGLSITGLPQAVEKLVAEPFNANAPLAQTVPLRNDRDKKLGLAQNDEKPAKAGSGNYPPIQGPVGNAVDLRGRKGPKLHAQQWFTGKPNTEGRVIVAEFWATWCGPCIRGIPHLNELQAAFPKQVVVVGISDEAASKVKPAISRLKMKYTVATDPTRRMRQMIQNRGIPHAIVMSPDGIVRWQGHPASLDKATLGKIVSAADTGGGSASQLRWTSPDA